MTDAARRVGFFILEAEEYLAELQPRRNAGGPAETDRFARAARALRGAALMAGLPAYAEAAAQLERIAHQLRSGALEWSSEVEAGWQRGIDGFRALLERATTWGETEDSAAHELSLRLTALAVAPTPDAGVAPVQEAASPPPASPTSTTTPDMALTPGVRAFLAREVSLIAGGLEQAAAAHVAYPPIDALQAVLERMQALRGLGSATALSPLPDLLDAMELATRSLLTDVPPPPGVGNVLADAAAALAGMARTVSESGRVVIPPQLESVGSRLLEGYASEADVVPIASLAPESMPSVALAGRAGSADDTAAPVAVELVGVGDHLLAQADALAAPRSDVARDLRLFVLHRTLATMPTHGGTGRFLAPLAKALADAIARGEARATPEAFVAMLRAAGTFLGTAAVTGEAGALRDGRTALLREIGGGTNGTVASTAAVDALAGTPIISIAALAPDAPDDVVSIESLAPAADDEGDVVAIASLAPAPDEEDDVVPIASLAPADDEADVVAIASLAPTGDDETDVVPIASLAPMEDDATDVVSIASLAPDVESRLTRAYRRRAELDATTPAASPSLGGLLREPVREMHDLVYTGESALARAEELRGEISVILSEPLISLERIRPLVEELLDLVPLARRVA